MPNSNATRFELAVYAGPEYAEKVEKLFAVSSDNCLLLDIERLIGLHIDGGSWAERGLHEMRRATNAVDYGADIAEAYMEDKS